VLRGEKKSIRSITPRKRPPSLDGDEEGVVPSSKEETQPIKKENPALSGGAEEGDAFPRQRGASIIFRPEEALSRWVGVRE